MLETKTKFTIQSGLRKTPKFEFAMIQWYIIVMKWKSKFTTKFRIPGFDIENFCLNWMVNYYKIELKHEFTIEHWQVKFHGICRQNVTAHYWFCHC